MKYYLRAMRRGQEILGTEYVVIKQYKSDKNAVRHLKQYAANWLDNDRVDSVILYRFRNIYDEKTFVHVYTFRRLHK